MSRRYRNRERVDRLARVGASFVRAAGASVRAGVDVHLQAEPGVADSGDLETDLGELLDEIGHAAQEQGSGAVIFIDDLQDASPEQLIGVVGACHRVNQAGLPALVVGAGLPTVGRTVSEASPTPSACSTSGWSACSTASPRTRRSPGRRNASACRSPPTPSPRCASSPAAIPSSSRPTSPVRRAA